MPLDYEVAVVGAGPAGLICAQELVKSRKKVVVFEEDKAVGEPTNCAGLLSKSGLRRLDIKPGRECVLNEVKGARFFSADGNTAEIRASEGKAYVLDRRLFDQQLAREYKGDLMLNAKCRAIERKKASFELKTDKKTITAGSVVLSTGPDFKLAEPLGFHAPKTFINTIQYEIDGVKCDLDFVELYFGSVAPGFFAWLIPTGESTARIGLGAMHAPEKPTYYLKHFLGKLKADARFGEDNKILRKGGGLIPVYDSRARIEKGRAFLLGDTAGQVKATTGGGVIMGGLSAKILADCITNGKDYDQETLQIKKELERHLLVRRVINKFGDEQYSHMVDFLKKPEIKSLIEEKGDMDMVSPLIDSVVKNPALALKAMHFLGKGLF
ncbi:MAG: NAD(P)/FAD-dependent oxidoreductase [Candidatus Altiarchaeota archaeon]|nr:NAD(P)/FAD-dependent oxidoreductase [Candidatus Altiarchaeota archaeon]